MRTAPARLQSAQSVDRSRLRACLAAALVLTGLAIVPVSLSFDDKTITDTIRVTRVNMCLRFFTECTSQCGSRPPGAYEICMQECTAQFSRCIGNLSRGAASSGTADATPHPPVAPPKRTPRKILHDRVTGVTTTKAPPMTSPQRSSSTPLPISRLRSEKTKTPSPTPGRMVPQTGPFSERIKPDRSPTPATNPKATATPKRDS